MEPLALPNKNTDWTAPLVLAHMIRVVDDMDRRLAESINEQDKRWTELRQADAKAIEAALAAAALAVSKAEANAEKWRDNANEWRGAMDDKDKNLPTRNEVEEKIKGVEQQLAALGSRITDLKTWSDQNYGKASGRSDATAWVIAGVGMFFGVAALLFEIVKIVPR